MNPTPLLAVVMVVSLVGILGQPEPSRQNRADDAEREVRRMSDAEVRALIARDVKSLAHIWSEDLVVTNPLNQLVTRSQVLSLIESDTLAFESYDRRIEYIRVSGTMAVVAGAETVVWSGKMPLAGVRSFLRFTAVWVERDGAWREVARHANIVSRASGS